MLTGRPHWVRTTSDRGITHEYDGPVAAEQLGSIAAVPVVVGRRVWGCCTAECAGSEPIGAEGCRADDPRSPGGSASSSEVRTESRPPARGRGDRRGHPLRPREARSR